MANLVNLERVSKAYGVRPLLDRRLASGVGGGERIGVVGRNGDGKTTLLQVIDRPGAARHRPGLPQPRAARSATSHQGDDPRRHATRSATPSSAAAPTTSGPPSRAPARSSRSCSPGSRSTGPCVGLSGGERRRCSLAALLLGDARPGGPRRADQPPRRRGRRLAGRAPGRAVVGAGRGHPRPLVPRRGLRARPGRCTTASSTPTRAATPRSCSPRPSGSGRPRPRRHAGRTWCARSSPGCVAAPPARTSKPKFRIDAANALIEDEPPPRDRLELQRFATQRLGKDVVDVEDVDLVRGERTLLSHATWRLGPGRPGRASSASTAPARPRCCALLAGDARRPTPGRVKHGPHGRAAAPHPGARRPRPRGAGARRRSSRSAGSPATATGEITATSMLERFGFTGDRLTARIGDLSGGERRRFQLLRLLLTEPNVLLLDEPTNDLDIETLNVLEDFLDGWPGHPGRRLPRPLLPRAGHRLDLGAARRRPDLDAARRRRRVPRAARRRARRRRRRGACPARRAAPVRGASRGVGSASSGPPARRVARIEKQLARLTEREAGAARRDGRARRRLRAAGRGRRTAAGAGRPRRSPSRRSGSRPPTSSTDPA